MIFIKFLAKVRKLRKNDFILSAYLQNNIKRAEQFEFNLNYYYDQSDDTFNVYITLFTSNKTFFTQII